MQIPIHEAYYQNNFRNIRGVIDYVALNPKHLDTLVKYRTAYHCITFKGVFSRQPVSAIYILFTPHPQIVAPS